LLFFRFFAIFVFVFVNENDTAHIGYLLAGCLLRLTAQQ